MKTILRILIVFLLAASVFLPMTATTATVTRIDFTGSEWCDPETLTLIREWMAGPNYQARGLAQTCYDVASISQATGKDYIEGRILAVGKPGNFILSGKNRIETDEGGVWVGSWVLPTNSDTIQLIAHGEGMYEGMMLYEYLNLDGPFYGYITVK